MKSKKIILKDAYKGFTLDQDKIVPPEETVERIKRKLNAVNLDILKGTLRIDNGRLDIPVYVSVCGDDARAVTGTKKQMGKGATPNQAEASAVMELAERFSFFTFCNTPDNFIVDTYARFKENALPFDLIAKSVHDESEELPIARKMFETLPLRWTRAYNLTREQPVWLPFNWFFAINEFNGPSAGNCVEEALSQGICEIVERHVSSVISHNELSVPAIRPESATDAMVVEMLEKYERAGIQLYVSDFTMNIGIPSIGVMAYDPSTFPKESEIVWTAGTTPDPQKAFSRALTEVAQLAGDFNTGANYVASGLPKFNALEDAAFITNVDHRVDISDLPDISHDNIKVEIENCIAALSERGMEVIVVDTMHPQLDVPAFYTIIPGAHFRERAIGTSVGMFSAKLMASDENPVEAIRNLEQFEKALPGKYYTQFFFGTCSLGLNDNEAALSFFEKALALNPTEEDIPSIYSYMGVCLKDMGQYEKALDRLREGEKMDRERTDIYNLMGFCHFKLKEHEKAIACFEKAIKLNPTSAIDYANIASNYRDMGNRKEAIRHYEKALSMDPTIEFARNSLEKLRMS